MTKSKHLTFALLAFSIVGVSVLSACSSVSTALSFSTPTPSPTLTPYPTHTPQPTYTPYPTQTPKPTYTPYPTFTPTSLPTATPQKEEFMRDDFSSTATCFGTDANNFVRDGKFHMRLDAPNTLRYTSCDLRLFSNFAFEIDAALSEGSEVSGGYGVLFRASGGAFYNFQISPHGYYCLDYQQLEKQAVTMLGCWSRVAEIKKGKQTNRLKVIAMDDRIELYVNDAFVGYLRDVSLASGWIGLTAATAAKGNAHVVFDNVRVTEP